MGVRGLTTFISKNAEKYLVPYELTNTDLVIDGDNLSSQLFRWVGNCNGAFGGDYDYYFRIVTEVFSMFIHCNVRPLIIMDGGYESRKLKTLHSRFRGKIAANKRVNPHDCKFIFPLMMKEVFIEAAHHCNIKIMRCIFEADDELALLAKKLDCPLLSYDSDFYIRNIKYIPIITVTFKIYKRKHNDQEYDVKLIGKRGNLKFRKNKINKKPVKDEDNDKDYYNFMDCCLYETKTLVSKEFVDVKPELLPLISCLLGNDYIQRSSVKHIYQQLSIPSQAKRHNSHFYRISAIVKWLKTETLQSALGKILKHTKKDKREILLNSIKCAVYDQNQSDCESYKFFGFDECEKKSEEIGFDDTTIHETESNNSLSSDENDDDDDDDEDSPDEEDDDNDEIDIFNYSNSELDNFPEWFKLRYKTCELSRYLVNLISLKFYVSTPQIEDYELEDVNLISKDILLYIFSLLHYPEKPSLKYISRNRFGHNVENKIFEALDLKDYNFNPNEKKNLRLFKLFFENLKLNKIFERINEIPDKHQLLFISMYYWIKKSKTISSVHILCMIVMFLYFSSKRKKLEKTEDNQKFNDLIQKFINQDINFMKKKFETYFKVNPKVKAFHNQKTFSIIHSFSEFQSILFHMKNLNALLNYPYTDIQVSETFNGTFLFNLYNTLRVRTDIINYTKTYLFENMTNLCDYYDYLVDWWVGFVPNLAKNDLKKSTNTKNKKYKKSVLLNESQSVWKNDSNSDSDNEFNDINNKFSALAVN